MKLKINILGVINLKLPKWLQEARESYIVRQTRKVKIPKIEKSSILRKRLIFSGKVQNVGFRLETYEMGRRLGLTGFVKNREDKKVEAEIQGEEKKIDYLISYLKSVKRIEIEKIGMKEIPIIKDEEEFEPYKNK